MSTDRQRGPHYEVAQICRNGHIINEYCLASPDRGEARCHRCGEPTLTSCPACHADIHSHWVGDYSFHGSLALPQYCHQCGAAYPWTEKKLEAMRQMVEEAEGLDEGEREALQESMAEITKDTPAAAPAAERVKKLIGKLAPKVSALVWDWSIEVASTTAAKVLKP